MVADPKSRTIVGYNPNHQNEKKEFTFDFTYSPESTQEQIFNETALPILTGVMEGYNGTIFAYGQTGTGKTFTMEGGNTPDMAGIVPRTIDWIFSYIKKTTDKQFLVQASFIEIYMEEVRDLLGKNSNKLTVREKDGVFYVEDSKQVKVESPEEMNKLMHLGRLSRKTGETKMNPGSSRSHSIFQIIVESSEEIDGEVKYKMGKLNLVDLAGSERQDKTGATGERLKEATKINLSLSILGNVISALVSGKGNGFVPYRESKLTMLLSDSLGGNTKTVMIANIGPADYNYDESINTLWYAARAKKIQNKPKINEDPKDALLRSYQEEIENMKKQLSLLGKGGIPMKQITNSEGKIVQVEDTSAVKKMEEQLEQEKENFRKQKEDEINKINQQKNLAEEEKKRLIEKIEKEKDEFKRNKEDAKKLLNKYKDMKSKVLNSDDTHMKVKKQEEEIKKTKEELYAIKLEEERLKRDLEEKSKSNLEIQIKYKDIQAHLEDLNKKIQLVRDTIEKLKVENKENVEKLQSDLLSLQDYNKVLTIENSKKEFIIKHFIPQAEKDKIIDCIDYDEKDEAYFINRKKAIKKNYKSNREIINKMKNNQTTQLDGYMKFKNERSEAENMISLNFEFSDKLVSEFTGDPNPHYISEVEHILKDDDSDLLYFDKELNFFDSNVLPISDTGLSKDLINNVLGLNAKPKRVQTASKK